jgi:cytochrome c biogenesis protein CcmG/thiol:disulfide interchange protein DsbE
VVINFWSTWCIPCKYEHPHLAAAAREFKDQVTFLGVVHEDTEDNVRSFLSQYGSVYMQLLDPNSSVAVDYGLSGVPETFFVDPTGKLADRYAGPISRARLNQNISQLLGRP